MNRNHYTSNVGRIKSQTVGLGLEVCSLCSLYKFPAITRGRGSPTWSGEEKYPTKATMLGNERAHPSRRCCPKRSIRNIICKSHFIPFARTIRRITNTSLYFIVSAANPSSILWIINSPSVAPSSST